MKIATVMAAAALAACSPLPPHVSEPGALATDGTRAEFTRCGLGVTFSGAPQRMSPDATLDLARTLANLPKSAKWETDGLAWGASNRAEAALCLCTDAPLGVDRISSMEDRFKKSKTYRSVGTIDAPFSRASLAAERAVDPGPLVTRLRVHLPVAAPSCYFFQAANFEPGAPLGADTFLGSTRPTTLR